MNELIVYDKKQAESILKGIIKLAADFADCKGNLTELIRNSISRAQCADEVKDYVAETRKDLVSALKAEYGEVRGADIWAKMADSFKTLASNEKKKQFGSEQKKEEKKKGYITLSIEYKENGEAEEIAIQISELLSNYVSSEIYVALSKLLAENVKAYEKPKMEMIS